MGSVLSTLYPPQNRAIDNGKTSLDKYCEELDEKLNRKRAELDDLKCENDMLKQTLEKIEVQLADKHETEISQMKHDYEANETALRTEIIRLNNTITSLEKTVQDSVNDDDKSESEISQMRHHYEEKEAEFGAEIIRLNNTITSLRKTVRDSVKAADKHELEHKEKEAALRAEIILLNNNISFLQKMVKDSVNATDKRKAEISQMQYNYEANETTLRTKITRLKTTITSLEKNVHDSEKAVDQHKAEISQLQDNYKTEKAALRTEITRLNNTISTLQKTYQNSVTVNSAMNSKEEVTDVKKIETDDESCDENVFAQNVTVKHSEATLLKHKIITDLIKACSTIFDSDEICTMDDILVNGVPVYQRLNRKILVVNKLQNNGTNWIADGTVMTYFPEFFINEFRSRRVNVCSVINKVYCNNLKKLWLEDTTISYFNFQKMVEAHTIQSLTLHRVTVKDKFGIEIGVADLFKEVPNVVKFEYAFKEDENMLITAKNFAKLGHFSKLQHFHLSEIQSDFDIKAFAEFVKKNPFVSYELGFRCASKYYAKIKSFKKDVIRSMPSPYKLQMKIF